MNHIAVQDTYPDELSYCYGCGRLNPDGHQIKTYLASDHTLTEFTPRPYHTAVPGFAYGGLLASLIDCHSTGSAAIFAGKRRGLTGVTPRFVTASLQVEFERPTPLEPLRLIGREVEVKGRKVVVETELYAGDKVCVRGRVVAVEIPENMRFGAPS